MQRPLALIVLAAGQGTRMRSSLPKVLHELCGRPMLHWLLDAASAAGGDRGVDEIVVVVGHGAEAVTAAIDGFGLTSPVRTVVQAEQRGTGDAVRCALDALAPGDRDVLVVPGDMPVIAGETLARMVDLHDADRTAVTLLTAEMDDPTGYGRVVRSAGGRVARIVEQADCSTDQTAIREVAVSTYVFTEPRLRDVIGSLRDDNAQGELYLTDAVESLLPDVDSVTAPAHEVLGVNDRVQLAAATASLRRRTNERWMRAGVTMVDPATVYIDADVTLREDVTLAPNVVLQGATTVAAGAVIGPDVQIVDSEVGECCVLRHCVVRGCTIAAGADVGPYASLRPGCAIGEGAHVGTFVEMKMTVLGVGSKAPHLSYIGDATIGDDANLGANTITCNWDGVDKHATVIGDGVRTGSGTLLVAPVTIGDGAYTGAGAVVVDDVPAGALAKGVPADVVEGWTVANRPKRGGDD